MSGITERLRLPIMLVRRGAVPLALALVALFSPMSAAPARAATIVVTTGSNGIVDNGQCSLTEALANAENDALTYDDCLVAGQGGAVVDTIAFNITNPAFCPGGVCTIKPAGSYTISKSVTIDGYTQPGASPNTLVVGDNAVLKIELDGELVGSNDGLKITGGTVTVRGLVINRYASGTGINVSGGSGHRIVGNFIGTDVTGSIAPDHPVDPVVGPEQVGIRIGSPGMSNSTVGGTTPGARNLISGNNFINAFIENGSTGNHIEGNYIGTNASGTGAIRVEYGIVIDEAANNTIGGTAPGAGNVISGNRHGVLVDGDTEIGNRIQGNLIGVDAAGTSPLGNIGYGVFINAPGTTVGGTEAGAGNTIAFNGSASYPDGVRVQAGTGNAILGNRIFSNFGLGINLGTDGVTPNDAGDADTGPNNRQNFPILTAGSVGAGAATVVGGTLNSVPNRVFQIELFVSSACDALGHGEGQTFLGSVTPSTDSSGNAGFVASLPVVPVGQVITATATNLVTNDTSEFSACIAVQQAGITVTPISGPTTEANEGGSSDASFTVRLNSVPAADVTLTLTVSDPTEGAIVGPTTLTFTPANGTTAQAVRLIGVDDTVQDGNVIYAVVFAAATGNDAAYAGLKPPDLTVTNLDDDTPCLPRPNVRITTTVASPGQLSATITAQTSPSTPTNGLSSVRLTRIDNATVTLNGSAATVGPTVTFAAGTSQATLLIQRQEAGRASTVSFVALDSCGEWPTFVGGGPSAF